MTDTPTKTLGALLADALKVADQLKANGATATERAQAIERVLRAHWPVTREWHFLCDRCDDTGLEMHDCPGEPSVCGRTFLYGPHTYGTPCWCEKGARFRETPKATKDDFAQAGKGTKRMTRVGR